MHCGASHSMAVVKRSGRVYTWGKNTQGQCGRGVQFGSVPYVLNRFACVCACVGNLEDMLRPMVNTTLKSEVIVKVYIFDGAYMSGGDFST